MDEPIALRMRGGDGDLQIVVLEPQRESRRDKWGYDVRTYRACFRDIETAIEMGGPEHEAYRVVNEYRPNGYRAEQCGTSQEFRFSGMTREMSAGSAGYCRLKMPGSRAMVDVFYSCPKYRFTEDADRPHPYIR